MKNRKRRNKHIFRRVTRFLEYRVLHIDDSAHRIALGVAFGFFIAYLPPVGIHIPLAILLPIIFHANKAATLGWIWVCNPFTVLFIFYPNYLVGRMFLRGLGSEITVTAAEVKEALEVFGPGELFTGLFTSEFWVKVGQLFGQIGIEIAIGGVILGSLLGGLTYFITYKLIRHHRAKKPRRRYLKHD